ncbi:hypothetical protein FKW77_004894 [Venturia effusa]|uniref:Major facilitator superfamily (MFS) profile domain-containing protein n=1 Tax=Venturia effusa TaxID=50376 RepID=A0A517L7A9_9PEZI|nr:hypothetical protein FKW77_004894 [Venturia effusa]
MEGVGLNERVELDGKSDREVEKSPVEKCEESLALQIDQQAEARLVRKLDIYIIPIITLLVNIGNARLYGLERDLKLKGNQYQIAVSLLFVTYILGELPSNLIIKKIGPSRWVPFLCICWGLIATLTGVVRNFAGLVACRLLLGLFEGGLFPGIAVYLTLFYRKNELALRVGYLFVSAAIAGAFGGLLAFAIGHMNGVAGQSGWRWIMILEGIPTILLGIFAWFWMADSPETAHYLTEEEKQLLLTRRSREAGQTASAQELDWEDVILGLKDWKIWAFCIAQFGVDTMLYGFSTFLPTIIKGINPKWSSPMVQVLTIPCYTVGAFTYLSTAWLSDRYQRRGLPLVSLSLVVIVGYAMLLSNGGSGVHYAGCFFVAMGLYIGPGLPVAWLANNNPRYGKRATAIALLLMIGNCAGIMAPFLYPSKEGPRYVRGQAVTIGLVAMAGLVHAFMTVYFAKTNKSRARGDENAIMNGLSEEEIEELGDRNPRFVYAF